MCPSPIRRGYEAICERHGIDPERALFADDMVRNLAPAKAIGMTTLVGRQRLRARRSRLHEPDFVDYRTARHCGLARRDSGGESGMTSLQQVIDAAWEDARRARHRDQGRGPRRGRRGDPPARRRRGARRREGRGGWTVNQWLKKAVLLSFRLNPMQAISGGPGGAIWWDKVPSKFARLGRVGDFDRAGFRAVPGVDRPPRRLYRPRARC